MTFSQSTHAQIAPIAFIVAALGAVDWVLAPERALTWIIGMGTMAAIWLVVGFVARSRATQTDSERRLLTAAAVFGGVMLALSLGVKLAAILGVGGDALIVRWKGVFAGLLLAAMGNAMPKVLGPLAAKRCSPARTLSVQRFAGWTFMIAGLVYAAVWIFATVPQADDLSMLACASAVILVIARCAWAFVSPGRNASPT